MKLSSLISFTALWLAVACGPGGESDASVPTDTGVDAGAPADAGIRDDAGTSLDADTPDDAATGEPDASTGPEPCSTAGQTRVVSCGNCGMGSQRCSEELVWVDEGPCIGEGACAAGAIEVEPTERCGERARICSTTCEWSDWDQTEEPGVCDPGASRTREASCDPGFHLLETCDDACTWQPDPGGCRDACGGMGRTSPPEAEEVCVPSGPFVRGDTLFTASQPVAEVFVSTFLIDRFLVTNDRYRACVAAGVCTPPPERFNGTMGYEYAPAGDNPVRGVTWEQAVAFCDWDGGRRLPTEAQWEKAARGPAPRAQPYTWDGPTFRCDLLYAHPCGWEPGPDDRIPGTSYYLIGSYDSQPGTASYYGAEMLIGSWFQLVRDFFAAEYYANPESLVDPAGPATGVYHVSRGNSRGYSAENGFHVSRRRGDISGAFRCARSIP